MNRTFMKGKLKKKISYAYLSGRLHNVCPHAVSMHGSDKVGRIRTERERYEEFANEEKAKQCFREWAAELISDGWECLEGLEPEECDKSEEQVTERTGPLGIRKCKFCGTELMANTSRHWYCSKKCQAAAKRKRERDKRPKLEPRKCEWCRKEFVPVRSSNRYCSNKCSSNACAKRRQERIKQERDK